MNLVTSVEVETIGQSTPMALLIASDAETLLLVWMVNDQQLVYLIRRALSEAESLQAWKGDLSLSKLVESGITRLELTTEKDSTLQTITMTIDSY